MIQYYRGQERQKLRCDHLPRGDLIFLPVGLRLLSNISKTAPFIILVSVSTFIHENFPC